MHKLLSLIAALLLVVAAGCSKGEETTNENAEGEESASESEGEGEEESNEANTEESEPEPTEEAFEGVRDGKFVSERFNLQFNMPPQWQYAASAQGSDSVTLTGPDGLEMVMANTQSVQLADTNFASLNDRVSFEQVNIVPDRTDASPVNGFPGYRVEGDALLRGDEVPIYFISQAINLPGEPVMATIYIPGDSYDLHSDVMKSVLDSIEALNIRPE